MCADLQSRPVPSQASFRNNKLQLTRKNRREDKAPTARPAAPERVGEIGGQTNERAPPSPENPPTAPDTSEGTLIGSPGAVQPGSEESTAAPRENPLKRRPSGPDLSSPDSNLGASPSPRSASRTLHAKSSSTGQAARGRDPDYQRSQTATLRSGALRLFNHKAEDSVGGNIPPYGIPSKGVGGIFNYPQASQYDSSKEAPSTRPADLGATGHVPSALEPRSGKGTKPRILRKKEPGLLPAPNDLDVRKKEPGLLLAPDDLDEPEGDTSMLRQPETRPISHDQLVVEVKGIYAGLVMVEAKCIEVDERQKVWALDKEHARKNPVTSDQWRSLIALHKQLLHEHHDFFLASQHPSASNNLSRLAAKYIMPARMWRHGIHGFLEVLRHRLPGSLDHMLAFIYIAYNMMALLFETVPSFEDTWIECLGDLGRYRMAIEDDEPRDREVWSNVARYWYSKASDKSPITGRLYHHLAILARPNTLEHLSLYTKALTCIVPFESAKGSILTLLNPVLSGKVSVSSRNLQIEILYIKAHAILFTQRRNQYNEVIQLSRSNVLHDFLYHRDEKGRDDNIGRVKKIGAYLAIANVSGILEYGATVENGTPRSHIRREHDAMNVRKGEDFSREEEETPGDQFHQKSHDTIDMFELTAKMEYHAAPLSPKEQDQSSILVDHASELAFATMKYTLSDMHWNTDAQIWKPLLALLHIYLVFIWSCCEAGTSINVIERFVPWAALCVYLNKLADKGGGGGNFVTPEDPFDEKGASDSRPLWEDFLLRGLTYTLWYFPKNWFSKSGLDEEERQLDSVSMEATRIARILWLGLCIASVRFHLAYRRA